MKKLLLIPALLAGTLALAEQKKVEISPMIGYNFAEGNLNVKDDGYLVGGVELQFNTPDSKISPEFSVLYSSGVDYKSNTAAEFKPGQDTRVIRGAFNGVYTFDETSSVIPFAKIGAGFEKITNESQSLDDGFFVDAGVGVKVPFTDYLALKLEAIYMAKPFTSNAGFADNNLVTMAGLTFSFGDFPQKAAPVVAPAVVAVVIIEEDDDNDGVFNPTDACPQTIVGSEVDEVGCSVDMDKDGVLNPNDLCKNTLPNTKVNSEGCPTTAPLKVNFENDSDKIKLSKETDIQKYADFLITNKNYDAKIVGYTDSVGNASYNQKLSEKRAAAVVSDLTSKGVSATQLSSVGAGETNPIADNATAEGRAENRRIEVELTRN